jgi:hypothetical protein
MKILPGAMSAVLLAASRTAVTVGVGGPVGPPLVLIVPAPVKLRVRPLISEPETVPFNVGNDPVAPAYAPVLVVLIVADPVPVFAWPEISESGTDNVPFRVPSDSVMVKSILTGSDAIALSGALALNCPLPIPERVAGPAAVAPLAPIVTVALETVNVVFTVAADAPAQKRTGRNIASFRIIGAPQTLGDFTTVHLHSVVTHR